MVTYRILADLTVLVHLAFVLFVVCGGVAVLKWPRLAWVHLPAAVWGAAIEFFALGCPLTPLETVLRARAGEGAYEGGFLAHYVFPVLYPNGLTRESMVALGIMVLVVNAAIYGWGWYRHRGVGGHR